MLLVRQSGHQEGSSMRPGDAERRFNEEGD